MGPLLDLLKSSSSAAKSAWLCQRLIGLLRRNIAPKGTNNLIINGLLNDKTIDQITDHQFVSIARMAISFGHVRPSILKKLSNIGATEGLFISTDVVTQPLLETFVENRDLRGLLPFLIPLSRHLTKQTAQQLDQIPVDALLPQGSDTPMISAAVAIIRIIRGLEPVEGLSRALSNLIETLQARSFRIFQFSRMVQNSPRLSSEKAIATLTMLCESQNASKHPYAPEVVDVLKSKLDARSSKFNDGVITDKLTLPSLRWLEKP